MMSELTESIFHCFRERADIARKTKLLFSSDCHFLHLNERNFRWIEGDSGYVSACTLGHEG